MHGEQADAVDQPAPVVAEAAGVVLVDREPAVLVGEGRSLVGDDADAPSLVGLDVPHQVQRVPARVRVERLGRDEPAEHGEVVGRTRHGEPPEVGERARDGVLHAEAPDGGNESLPAADRGVQRLGRGVVAALDHGGGGLVLGVGDAGMRVLVLEQQRFEDAQLDHAACPHAARRAVAVAGAGLRVQRRNGECAGRQLGGEPPNGLVGERAGRGLRRRMRRPGRGRARCRRRAWLGRGGRGRRRDGGRFGLTRPTGRDERDRDDAEDQQRCPGDHGPAPRSGVPLAHLGGAYGSVLCRGRA